MRLPAIAGLAAGLVAFAIYVVSSFSDLRSPSLGLEPIPKFQLFPLIIGGAAGFGLLPLGKFLDNARSGLVGLFILFLTATSSSALFSYFFASPLRTSAIYLALGFMSGALVNIVLFSPADRSPPIWTTKVERNVIHQAIVAGGLDPVECEVNTSSRQLRITHMPSRSRFVVHRPDLVYYLAGARYVIWSLVTDESDRSGQTRTWDGVVVYAQKWAAAVEGRGQREEVGGVAQKRSASGEEPGPRLRAPRSQLDGEIGLRLARGADIEARVIRSWDELDEFESQLKTWDEGNEELLRRRFTTGEVADRYKRVTIGPGGGSNPDRVERWLRDSLAEQMRRLESIRQNLPLIESEVEETEVTNTSAAPRGSKIFLVHGHDGFRKLEVAQFLQRCAHGSGGRSRH